MPSHLIQRFGFSIAAAGAVMALFGLAVFLYTRCAAAWVGRLGESGLACLGGSLVAVSLRALAKIQHWPIALPACFTLGLGFHMLHSTLQTLAIQMAPQSLQESDRRESWVAACPRP
ncbi:MAG: hypothetical protein Q7K57_54970 [Burkholderiaceae bacterium]|nr:hypothetical protein [Burkholderiaceae bacterium]